MFNLIIKYYLAETSLWLLFTTLTQNIGHNNSIKVGDIVKVTFIDYDNSEGTFNKAKILEMESAYLMLECSNSQWKLNLSLPEHKELSLTWKTMNKGSCKLLDSDEETELWELTHNTPWYIDYKSISNLIVERI